MFCLLRSNGSRRAIRLKAITVLIRPHGSMLDRTTRIRLNGIEDKEMEKLMERIGEVLRSNALMRQEVGLRRQLSTEDSSELIAMMESLVRRYPSQDLESSIDDYLLDYEALALKHGIEKVKRAVAALRIDPDQHFFPKPDEVANEIRNQWLKSLPSDIYARQ
jgi:hypothetical protein